MSAARDAFLLHRRPYSNSSEILHFLTPQGMVNCLAKGSKKTRSPFFGHLQPFIATSIAWRGQSGLKTLTQAEQIARPPEVDYNNRVAMMYVNEILMLLRIDEALYCEIHPKYLGCLKQLSNDEPIAPILRRFEWFLCCLLGYQLEVPVGVVDGDHVIFSSDEGLVLDNKHKRCTVGTFKSFIADQSFDLKSINWLMRAVVAHLTNHKPIKSRDMWL